MKEIFCKSCGKRFSVSDRTVSEAEKSALCYKCNRKVKVPAQ